MYLYFSFRACEAVNSPLTIFQRTLELRGNVGITFISV